MTRTVRPGAGRLVHDGPAGERGVVLLVSLLFLLLISVTAGVTVRSAAGTEAVANSARTQALALQAAEAALRHCEALVEAHLHGVHPSLQPEPAPAEAQVPLWQDAAYWDGAGAAIVVAQAPIAGAGAGQRAFYRRPPECMAQYQSAGRTATSVITARGFGPDVQDASPGRPPQGAEVWLQSILSFE